MTQVITIHIEVPDGVGVIVDGGGKPFVERPEPAYPDWDPTCHVHDVDWKLVPSGLSKTKVNPDGTPKRYNAFYACPERGCYEKPGRADDGDQSLGY